MEKKKIVTYSKPYRVAKLLLYYIRHIEPRSRIEKKKCKVSAHGWYVYVMRSPRWIHCTYLYIIIIIVVVVH